MRIMITGGTGFIGFHSATTLMDAGHEISLLVRSEEKMRGLYGDRISDFVVGDVTDESKVREALHNCDGVVHTAAMVSIDKKDAQRVHDTNVGGTRQVIGNAVDTINRLRESPLDESLSDAIRSLVRTGHISVEMAGKLAQ